jgi:hypothetical protein
VAGKKIRVDSKHKKAFFSTYLASKLVWKMNKQTAFVSPKLDGFLCDKAVAQMILQGLSRPQD